MQQFQIESAIYNALLKTIKQIGINKFKESTLFGRNDEVAEEAIERKSA